MQRTASIFAVALCATFLACTDDVTDDGKAPDAKADGAKIDAGKVDAGNSDADPSDAPAADVPGASDATSPGDATIHADTKSAGDAGSDVSTPSDANNAPLDASDLTDATQPPNDAVDPDAVQAADSTTDSASADSAATPDTLGTDTATSSDVATNDAGPTKLPPVKVPTHTKSGAWIDPPVEATWTYNYGFVSTMPGKIAVIDLAKPKHIVTMGGGNKLVHGAAVEPMQKAIWVPNFTTTSLDRYESLSKDNTVWKKDKSVKIPVLELGQVRGARDGSVIGVTAGIMPVQGTGFSDPKKAEKAKVVALLWPKTGKVKAFKLDSPVPIEVSTRGSTVYVGNWNSNTITIIDTKKEKVVGSWQIQQQGKKWDWIGPSHIQLSNDNRKLVSANLFDSSVAVFGVDDPSKKAVYASIGNVAHWAEFSPDDERVYCVRWDKLPDATNEKANASIPVVIQVRDATTLKLLKTFKWDYLVAHTAVPPPGSKFASNIFLMGSFGSVLRFDAKSYKLTGQALVTTNMSPPAMTMMF